MLQQDSGQTSVSLLLQLSAQTANTSLPAASLPDFHVSNSAVWVNSLWFLSLILSLTSALFGMIAKQWLREYMEWTTTSWLPQRTITLRQKRVEAFDEWKAPGIIAAIAALLEVALILFFAGLIVFLWTINHIVARVSIAAITTSVTLAVLATVLPVFRRRCPYKSPTGWACLRLAWLLAGAWNALWWSVYRRLPWRSVRRLIEHLLADCNPHETWRDRDFASGDAILSKEASGALGGADVGFVEGDDRVISFESTRSDKSSANLAALGRAFAWIRNTSQNGALLEAVLHCTETRVTDRCSPLALLAFDFSVACQALRMEPGELCVYLDDMYDITLESNQVEHASLRHDWRDETFTMRKRLDDLRRTQPHLATQLAKMLADNLGKLLSRIDLGKAYKNEVSARFLMRIAALCACMMARVDDDVASVASLASRFREVLDTSCELPGLRSTLFELVSSDPQNIIEHNGDREFNLNFVIG